MSDKNRIYIEDIKFGKTADGIACGPVAGCPVLSVKYRFKNDSRWLSCVNVEGIPNFFGSVNDMHDKLMDDDYVDDHIDEFNSMNVSVFEGIDLGEFGDILFSISKNKDNPAVPFIRLFLAVLTEYSIRDELIKNSKGKYADELSIPRLEIEDDYEAEDDFEDE